MKAKANSVEAINLLVSVNEYFNIGDIDKVIDLLNKFVRYVAGCMERPTGKNKIAKSNIFNNWFDKEYQTTKYNVRNKLRRMERNKCVSNTMKFLREKERFKNLRQLKKKAHEYTHYIQIDNALKENDNKTLWTLIKDKGCKPSMNGLISGTEWVDYYRRLYTANYESTEFLDECSHVFVDSLDVSICINEVENSSECESESEIVQNSSE